MPRALMEASLMGLPIVTTDVPGCNEVVQDGVTGLLVPERDHQALARAILHLAAEPEMGRLLGQQSRHHAVDSFDLRNIADKFRLAYRDLLSRNGRKSP